MIQSSKCKTLIHSLVSGKKLQTIQNNNTAQILKDIISLPIVVNGQWEPWTEWSGCSVTCATGTQERTRECVGMAHGGDPCDGSSLQNRTCFPKECPGTI